MKIKEEHRREHGTERGNTRGTGRRCKLVTGHFACLGAANTCNFFREQLTSQRFYIYILRTRSPNLSPVTSTATPALTAAACAVAMYSGGMYARSFVSITPPRLPACHVTHGSIYPSPHRRGSPSSYAEAGPNRSRQRLHSSSSPTEEARTTCA